MTDLATWLTANDHYLALSMAQLRLRLQRAAAATAPPVHVASSAGVVSVRDATASHGVFRRRPEPALTGRPAEIVNATVLDSRDWDGEIATAADETAQAAAGMSPAPALIQIAELFGLSDFARDVLLLCAARELDTGIDSLVARVHGQPWPTFAVAMTIFDAPSWDARSPGAPLRHWHLIEAIVDDDRSLGSCPLRIDERILDSIKGLQQLDARLTSVLTPVSPSADELPPSQLAVVTDAINLINRSTKSEAPQLLQLVGPHARTRTILATHIAAGFEHTLYRLQSRMLPTGAADIDLLARLWHRETLMASVALYVDDDDDAAAFARAAFLARIGGLVLIGGPAVAGDLAGASAVLDVVHPTAAEQLDLWRVAVGPDSTADVATLVEQFDLDGETIKFVVDQADPVAADTAADADGTMALRASARRYLRPQLEASAQRLRPVATWDSLVLPDAELSLLHQISSQVVHRYNVYQEWGFAQRMNRGLGVSALFAGESGTGKSMAAEVLANDLGLDLYRIDLSSVVSKYIGETEKNLRGLFDAAESGGVILFFDEADALFGKRSEVKDAHDRYANIETNYLLQRMEQYSGLAILATNMRSALDRAFTRRLRFIVTFPFPTVADRARMWQRAFPTELPHSDLDIDRLARIDLNGAGIAAAALGAAFTASVAGHEVTMLDVLGAARGELRKLDRPVNEAQFRLPAQAQK